MGVVDHTHRLNVVLPNVVSELAPQRHGGIERLFRGDPSTTRRWLDISLKRPVAPSLALSAGPLGNSDFENDIVRQGVVRCQRPDGQIIGAEIEGHRDLWTGRVQKLLSGQYLGQEEHVRSNSYCVKDGIGPKSLDAAVDILNNQRVLQRTQSSRGYQVSWRVFCIAFVDACHVMYSQKCQRMVSDNSLDFEQ
jgi:hypothetical protein